METLGLPSSLQSSWPSLKRLIRLKRVVFFRVLSINGLQNFIVLKGNFINSIWFINRQGKKKLLYACLDGHWWSINSLVSRADIVHDETLLRSHPNCSVHEFIGQTAYMRKHTHYICVCVFFAFQLYHHYWNNSSAST